MQILKRNLLACALVLTTALALADEVPALCIQTADGANDVALSQLLSIKYTDTDMVLTFADGTHMAIPMDEVVVMKLGVKSITIDALMEVGADACHYVLTDLQGHVVAQGEALREKSIVLPSRRGVYVLSVGDKSRKIIVR